jgi:hypothetical protein
MLSLQPQRLKCHRMRSTNYEIREKLLW